MHSLISKFCWIHDQDSSYYDFISIGQNWAKYCIFYLVKFLFHLELIICCCCLAAKLCLTLCDPTDCSPPGSSVHGISQAGILEWVAISFSRGSSWPRIEAAAPALAGRFFIAETLGKSKELIIPLFLLLFCLSLCIYHSHYSNWSIKSF